MESVVLPTRHSSTIASVSPRIVRTTSECAKNPSINFAARSSASRSSTSSVALNLSAQHSSLTSPSRKKFPANLANFSVEFSLMVTPLDNYYYNLEWAGMAAIYWRHYKAFTTVGEKVNFSEIFYFEFLQIYFRRLQFFYTKKKVILKRLQDSVE